MQGVAVGIALGDEVTVVENALVILLVLHCVDCCAAGDGLRQRQVQAVFVLKDAAVLAEIIGCAGLVVIDEVFLRRVRVSVRRRLEPGGDHRLLGRELPACADVHLAIGQRVVARLGGVKIRPPVSAVVDQGQGIGQNGAGAGGNGVDEGRLQVVV